MEDSKQGNESEGKGRRRKSEKRETNWKAGIRQKVKEERGRRENGKLSKSRETEKKRIKGIEDIRKQSREKHIER